MDSEPLKIAYASQRRYQGVRPPPRRFTLELLHWSGSVLAWTLGTLILIGVPLSAAYRLTGPVLGYPYLVLGILFMPVLAAASRSVRRRRAAAVLGYLQQAIRLNLPLNRFLAAAAASETGRMSGEITELRLALEGGSPLAVALSFTVRELPERSIALIDYAEQMGKLPQTLDRLVSENVGESRKVRENRTLVAWYPPVVLAIGGAVIGLMIIFVFPKFDSLFKGYHLQLPAVTRWILEPADWILFLVPIPFIILLLMSALQFREAVKWTRPTTLFRATRDRLLWMMPLAHGLIRDRAMADLCTALADSIELGHPLDQALARAQQLELNAVIKRRMQRWTQGLDKGRSPAQAAREAGMPRLLAGMLATAGDTSATGQVFRFLARFYSARFVFARELARGAFLPIATLIMGVLVAMVALALFLPMQRLIQAVSKGIR